MPVSIEVFEAENIVMSVYTDPFSEEDLAAVLAAFDKHYSPNGARLYTISDARHIHATFSDVVVSMAMASRKEGWKLGAPNTETVLVGTSEMVRLVTESAKQAQYGSMQAHLFEDVESALAFVRQHRQDNP